MNKHVCKTWKHLKTDISPLIAGGEGKISNSKHNPEQSDPKTYSFPRPDLLPSYVLPFIKGHIDVKGDGNCGFRTIAVFEYGDEEKWVDVRRDLIEELTTHKELHLRGLGQSQHEYNKASLRLHWFEGPCDTTHWMDTCLGPVVATRYKKIVTIWSNGESCTHLPLESRLENGDPPKLYINMGLFFNHFLALDMPGDTPLPPLTPIWKHSCHPRVKHWHSIDFERQFAHYRQICPSYKSRPLREPPIDLTDSLDSSRNTMKRKLEYGIKWTPSRKGKRCHDAKRKHNTKSHSRSNSLQFNLMNPANSVGHDRAVESLDGENQNILPDQAPFECNAVDNSTPDATMGTLKEPTVAPQCHSDDQEHAPEPFR